MTTAAESAFIEHPPASWIDPASGRLLTPDQLMHEMASRQAVLLGENHSDAEIHRWQLQVTTVLHFLRPELSVGFEMFPRRLQSVLDRWVQGGLRTAEFLREVEWDQVWGYDAELYLPLFHFCRQQRVRMLALNCHRPLVTRVGKEGWDAIPEPERDGLTPAAPALPEYRGYLAAVTGMAGEPSDRFVRAQQTWDRAFACNIARALSSSVPLVVGIIGRGHLEYGYGTPYQLRDLGVQSVGVLLPTHDPRHEAGRIASIADALFRLDEPDPPAPPPAKLQRAIDAQAMMTSVATAPSPSAPPAED